MITIIGPMRSGTSLAAKLACEAGVDMGSLMTMPINGDWPEYEDWGCVRLLQNPIFVPREADFVAYLSSRVERFAALNRALERERPIGMGFKSPLLVPHWEAWCGALKTLGMSQRVVAITRPVELVLLSLERSAKSDAHLQILEEIQKRIYEGLKSIEPDVTFELNDLRECPEKVGSWIHGGKK